MPREVLAYLAPENGGVYVDCTVGLGGHARAMLESGATRVIGVDRDPAALAVAAETLRNWRDRVELVRSDYRAIESVLERLGVDRIDGALADLGMSSLQLEAGGRGFSFQREEPLDMRMDTSAGPTAADLLRDAPESEIADVIYRYGEERFSRRIARAVVQARERAALETTSQLAALVRRAVPRRPPLLGRLGLRAFQAVERHPRWRYWLLDEREAAGAARLDEKARAREDALARKQRQREEKARRVAQRGKR